MKRRKTFHDSYYIGMKITIYLFDSRSARRVFLRQPVPGVQIVGSGAKKKGARKNKGEGGGEVREGTPVRFVLNRLFRPVRPHQLQVVFTCQSRLVLQPDAFETYPCWFHGNGQDCQSFLSFFSWLHLRKKQQHSPEIKYRQLRRLIWGLNSIYLPW